MRQKSKGKRRKKGEAKVRNEILVKQEKQRHAL